MAEQLLIDGDEPERLFAQLASDLESKCLSVIPAALSHEILDSLAAHLDQLSSKDFHQAGIGRGDSDKNRFVRNNQIAWHDPNDPRCAPWYNWLEALRTFLNRRLFLGISRIESHFTRYEEGDFYKRHVDAFKGEKNRIVSLVTYLNDGWQPDQGGELVLYPRDSRKIHVTPERGTLVAFLSEEIPHEVLPTERTRHGVAAWFRIDT